MQNHEAIAARVCEGTTLKPKNLRVLGCNGDQVLVQHRRHGDHRSRSQVELINLVTGERVALWQGVKLSGVKKEKLQRQYLTD